MRLGFKSLIQEYFRNTNWLNSSNASQQCALEEHTYHHNYDQLQSGQHQQEHSQQVKRSSYFTLHGTCEATSIKLYSVVGPLE